MKSKKLAVSLVVSFLLFQAVSFAADTADTKIEFGAMAAIENGQFFKSKFTGSPIPYKPWINNEYGRISVRATLSDHLQFIVAPEIRMWFDNYDWNQLGAEAFAYPFISHTSVSLANAQGILSYGDKEKYSFEFAAGVMPYKYNNEAKNLGEYLFRSGCRPAYIVTSFDNAYARMTGFRLSSTMFNKLSLDLFLTTETQYMPTLDWSVSFLAGYRILPSLEIGTGIMLDRLLPVDSTRERPSGSTDGRNSYFTSAGKIDYFSFGGTKMMARLCFDPKEALKDILPSSVSSLLGKQDGKIYAEAAILGVTNITPYVRELDSTGWPVGNGWIVDSSKNFYTDITQRIPVMFGFNIPTFSGYFNRLGGLWRSLMLDYLSVEWEWYGWPYPLGFGEVNQFRVVYPLPPPVQDASDPLLYTLHDNWKYSINFRKNVIKGFSIIGQVARDHSHYDVSCAKFNMGTFSTEAFSAKNEWGWWFKLQFDL